MKGKRNGLYSQYGTIVTDVITNNHETLEDAINLVGEWLPQENPDDPDVRIDGTDYWYDDLEYVIALNGDEVIKLNVIYPDNHAEEEIIYTMHRTTPIDDGFQDEATFYDWLLDYIGEDYEDTLIEAEYLIDDEVIVATMIDRRNSIYVLSESNDITGLHGVLCAYKSREDGIKAFQEEVLEFLRDERGIDTSWENLEYEDAVLDYFETITVDDNEVYLDDGQRVCIWKLEEIPFV